MTEITPEITLEHSEDSKVDTLQVNRLNQINTTYSHVKSLTSYP